MSKNTKLIVSISVLVLIIIGCGYWYGQQSKSAMTQQLTTKPVLVTVANVQVKPVAFTIDAVGTVVAKQTVLVSSEVPGQILTILFKQGQHIKKGTPLIHLDDASLRAQLQSDQADLTLSELNYKRMQRLIKTGATAKQSVDQARATLEEKQAAVAMDKANLAKATVMAPFTGILGERLVDLGEYITAGQALVRLVATNNLRVDFQVAERYLPELSLGQAVRVIPGAHQQAIQAKVTFIAPDVNISSRSVAVQASITQTNGELRPGQFVDVKQTLRQNDHAVVVPEESLVATIGGAMVYKIVDGKAVAVPVKVGAREVGVVQILKGLQKGDVVVTTGQQKLRDGAKIKEIKNP